MKLLRAVVAVDYGRRDDLDIRFKHSEESLGEPEKEGLAIFFYEGDSIVAVELMDLTHFR